MNLEALKIWVAQQRRLLEEAGILPKREVSSKACACGNTRLVLLSTYREKHCTDCNTTIPWPLDEGQKPAHRPHRADRKEALTHGK